MWMKTGRNLEAQTQKWMSESVQNIHTQFFVIAIKHSIWTCFQNTGRRLACSTHHKSLESETPRFPLRLTSPSTVVAGITPSPSLQRTILTPSSCRYDLSKRDHCQTQICNQEAVVTRSNTCYLLTFLTSGPWAGETGWERDSRGGVGQDAGDHETPQVYWHDALNVSFSSGSRLEN